MMENEMYGAHPDGDRVDDPRPTMYHCGNCSNDFACSGIDMDRLRAHLWDDAAQFVQNGIDAQVGEGGYSYEFAFKEIIRQMRVKAGKPR